MGVGDYSDDFDLIYLHRHVHAFTTPLEDENFLPLPQVVQGNSKKVDEVPATSLYLV